jgi:nucleoside-diphosphate-sugar epimerase
MHILVTGYQGYLGSTLVPLLLTNGHHVTGLDNHLFRRTNFSSAQFEIPILDRDIRHVELADLHGFDAVIHLAGLAGDPLCELNPQATQDVNYTAAVRLASLAKYAGIERFVFSSTCAVYGNSPTRFVNEESLPNPLSNFAHTKLRAERDIACLADASFSPVFLRKPSMYGFSPFMRTDVVLNNLVAWAAITGRVTLKSDGLGWRPLMHVQDVAQAFAVAVTAPARHVHNQIFNVCVTEENYQVNTLARKVQLAFDGARIEYITNSPRDPRSYRVDGRKIAAALPEFTPLWTLDQGIEELRIAYAQRQMTLEDFEGTRYKRVAHVKALLTKGLIDNAFFVQGRAATKGT